MSTHGNLRITMTRDADTVVVALVGDLDVYVAGDARKYLDEAVDRAVAHSVTRLVLDATGLGFCDSTGLSVVVQAQSMAEHRGVKLLIRNLSEPLRELLRLTGLDALVE
jgi:anti-anti-sigma factor